MKGLRLGRIPWEDVLGHVMEGKRVIIASDIKKHKDVIAERIERIKGLVGVFHNDILENTIKLAFVLISKMENEPEVIQNRGSLDVVPMVSTMTVKVQELPEEQRDPLRIAEAFAYATMNVGDICWISQPQRVELFGDKEDFSKIFRCIKFHASSYFVLMGMYDFFVDGGDGTLIFNKEYLLIRMPEVVSYYSLLISSLSSGDKERLEDLIDAIDNVTEELRIKKGNEKYIQ